MPHTNVGRAVAALLGFVLLSGCLQQNAVDPTQVGIEDPGVQAQQEPVSEHMAPAEQVHLASVTDGDTLRVTLSSGASSPVRLIGIDTPETYPELQCGGPEATANMQKLVRPGDPLQLYIDPTQDEVDRYDRLLRYVLTDDDRDVGLAQVETGHASVYVYNNNPFVALDTYQAAEDDARSNNGGIWGAC